MIKHDLTAERFLRGLLPTGWEAAAGHARRLAEETRYLPWADRARVFDRFLWAEAGDRLAKEEVTAIVNRQRPGGDGAARVAAYALFCRGVLTAALLLIEDTAAIDHAAAAVVHSLSLDRRHQDAAADWMGHDRRDALASGLRGWPGCAFLLLVAAPNDSADSFLARDAFWAAMLGRS